MPAPNLEAKPFSVLVITPSLGKHWHTLESMNGSRCVCSLGCHCHSLSITDCRISEERGKTPVVYIRGSHRFLNSRRPKMATMWQKTPISIQWLAIDAIIQHPPQAPTKWLFNMLVHNSMSKSCSYFVQYKYLISRMITVLPRMCKPDKPY